MMASDLLGRFYLLSYISMRKLIFGVVLALGAMVPAFAFAQTATTGLLTVYVQVMGQTGYSAFPNYSSSNFTVSVSGNTASLTNFQGSQSGTPVQLYPGNYNVTVNSLSGYTPTYSVGCNNTISSGQSQTCVVTMTPTYSYGTYPYNNYNYYNNYPYGVPALTCQANTPSIAIGQPVTFTALGGAGGTYNWVAPYTQTLNYPNAGTQLTVAFQAAGQQSVQVTNAAQTASCSVLVTQGYYPYGGTSYYPYNNNYPNTNYAYSNPSYTTTYTNPTTTYYPSTNYYPALPHTGFGPKDNTLGFVLSAVLLIAAGIMVAPYARKAFAVASR
jgi:hypothetical protein